MVTIHVVLQDSLVNGQLGTVKSIVLNSQNNVWEIYIKFDDFEAGLKKINTNNFARQHSWVLVEKTTVDIRIKLNKNSSPAFKRAPFLLMLAGTCGIYKIQGFSLSKIAVSFQLLKQGTLWTNLCCFKHSYLTWRIVYSWVI